MIGTTNIVSLRDIHNILSNLLAHPEKYHISQSDLQVGSGMTVGVSEPHVFDRIRMDLIYISQDPEEGKVC